MATVPDLQQLTDHIRNTLPNQQFLAEVQLNEQAGIVRFSWHSRHFVAKPTLEVFELKGASILITSASMLMDAALRTKDRNVKGVGAIITTLQ